MRMSRSLILFVLAGLTLCFLGASYAMWFNASSFALMGSDEPATPSAAATAGSAAATHGVRLTVPEAGITSVSAAQLRSAGLPFIELSNEELSLTHNGQPVPFAVEEVDGEPILFFYAWERSGAHAPDPVYWLQPGEGVAMATRAAPTEVKEAQPAAHKMVWDQNQYFVEEAQGEDAWMGPLLLAPDRWSLELEGIQPDGGPATLTLHLLSTVDGPGEPDHHITVLINGREAADYTWDGVGPETLTIPVPAGLLHAADDNEVEVLAHENDAVMGEAIYIDGLELSYGGPVVVAERPMRFTSVQDSVFVEGESEELLVFDISEEQAPELLTQLRADNDGVTFDSGGGGAEFVALAAGKAQQPQVQAATAWEDPLRDGRWGADYIAIVADVAGFESAVEPLLAHRKEQGLRVVAIPLEQIFDEFGYGQRDPEAIKAFLAHAADNWKAPAPRYVLLVGDATYDVADRTSGRNRNRLPTAMVFSKEGGYVASDAWFVDFAPEVETPPMAIGRFPAQNAPQLSAMVEKTVAYETQQPGASSGWVDDALLVQDGDPSFEGAAQRLAEQLDAKGYQVYRLEAGPGDNVQHSVISALNQGVGLISYVGHGSEGSWGGGEALQNSDVQLLTNSTRLPVLSTFTCRSGSFASPQSDSLAESLLRASGGGIIAAVAPAGRIANGQEVALAERFQEQLLSGTNERLGDAMLGLYAEMQGAAARREALTAVNLLGDPALQVRRPSQ